MKLKSVVTLGVVAMISAAITAACSGEDGAMGPAGQQGASGSNGSDGQNGAAGAQGPQGPVGEAGATGTFAGSTDAAVVLNGSVMLNMSSRVRKTTATMTGTVFAATTTGGGANNVCVNDGIANAHPCTAWEAMMLDTLSAVPIFDEQGWIVGSFPNLDGHMRSLVNGQDSVVCPGGDHLIKYPSAFTHNAVTTPGGLHCLADTETRPVWCCMDRGF